jgi:hypothetical protein
MSIIALSDFKGEYNIATNPDNTDKVEVIIAEREEEILIGLFGLTMYNTLKDQIIAGGANPDDPLYVYIFEPFQYKDGCYILNSKGIKWMLCNMIYVFIAREGYISNTTLGDRVNVSEVSIGVNWMKAITNYNRGIDTYRAIQAYIGLNSTDYPDYIGECKQYMGMI